MPDNVLRWVWDAGRADELTTDLIIRQYQAVNDTLNDQLYEPELTDPQAWCRGYLAGFVADMTAWAPLTAAQPELLKVILSNAQDQPLDSAKAALAEAAHRIHVLRPALISSMPPTLFEGKSCGVSRGGLGGAFTAQ